MKLNKAITILKQHNEWRRGSYEVPMTDTVELGKAIDLIVTFADKVTGEPSEGMVEAGYFLGDEGGTFMRMINQAIKEIEDE